MPIGIGGFGASAYGGGFKQVEKLAPPKRKQIVQILDAFLGSEKAKKTG